MRRRGRFLRAGVLVVVACSVSLVASVCSVAASDDSTGAMAVRLVSPLKTRDGAMVDAQGRPVRFLGIDITQLAPGRGQSSKQTGSGCTGWASPDNVMLDNIRDWGFNVVRLSISWANMEPNMPISVGPLAFHFWNENYLRAVDAAVWGLTKRGVAVMLEMSQDHWSPAFDRYPGSPCPGRGFPAWLYEGTTTNTINEAKMAFFRDDRNVQELTADAWGVLAKRYSGNRRVVAADMVNEPYAPRSMNRADMHLGEIYQKLGTAIRAQDPDILLVFQDSQDLGIHRFALQEPPHFYNVVYEFHLYTDNWTPDGKRRLQRYESRARTWNVPLFIGEFNAFKYGSDSKAPSSSWRRDTRTLMARCKADGVGWVFFAYKGGNSIVSHGTDEPKPGLLPVLQGGY